MALQWQTDRSIYVIFLIKNDMGLGLRLGSMSGGFLLVAGKTKLDTSLWQHRSPRSKLIAWYCHTAIGAAMPQHENNTISTSPINSHNLWVTTEKTLFIHLGNHNMNNGVEQTGFSQTGRSKFKNGSRFARSRRKFESVAEYIVCTVCARLVQKYCVYFQ